MSFCNSTNKLYKNDMKRDSLRYLRKKLPLRYFSNLRRIEAGLGSIEQLIFESCSNN